MSESSSFALLILIFQVFFPTVSFLAIDFVLALYLVIRCLISSIDFLSLIDAQRTLLDYHLSYQRALADNRQKLAELEMLAGTELN